MGTKKIFIIIIIAITTMLFILSPIVKADVGGIDRKTSGIAVEDYNPNGKLPPEDVEVVSNKFGPIIGTLKVIGVVLSAIGIVILGIKFMLGSTSERAEYKKALIPYIVGVFMIVSITVFLVIIEKIVNEIKV